MTGWNMGHERGAASGEPKPIMTQCGECDHQLRCTRRTPQGDCEAWMPHGRWPAGNETWSKTQHLTLTNTVSYADNSVRL